MNRSLLSTTLLCIPLALAACDGDDASDGSESGLGGETGGMGEEDGTDPTGDEAGDSMGGEAGDTEDTDGEPEPEGCNVDSPYMGGWDIGCCQDEVVPTAWAPGGVTAGSVLPDWTVNDQFGDAVRLYDFCHDAIYFEYAAVW